MGNAKSALEEALREPGKDVPVADDPPPRAYFRVIDDRLWARFPLWIAGPLQTDCFEVLDRRVKRACPGTSSTST